MSKGRGGFIGQNGLNAPDSPTDVSASAGDSQATVTFTAPSDVGGSEITGYRAQSDTGIGASGSSSPITVTGLSNGTSYTFNVWAINAFGYSAPSNASTGVTPAVAPLGVMVGGGQSQNIQKLNTVTLGNATDFGGDTNVGDRQFCAGASSSTRGVYIGGNDTPSRTSIEYITFASAGNATDFGDCDNNYGACGMSNGTRAVFASNAYDADDMEYVTIASTGNTSTFGTISRNSGCYYPATVNNTTRGVFAYGLKANFQLTANMDYITIASTGNSSTFGDLTFANKNKANGVVCTSTRGLFLGGMNLSDTKQNSVEYITIASTGGGTDFGDLTQARADSAGISGTTRGFCCGGYTSSRSNVIDYVEIATTGNFSDYGDLVTAEQQWTGMSQVHGGLS